MSEQEKNQELATTTDPKIPTNEELFEELQKLKKEVEELKRSRRSEHPAFPPGPHDRMIKYAPIGGSSFGLGR